MRERRRILGISALSVGMVASGIGLLLRYAPMYPDDTIALFVARWWVLAGAFVLTGALGALWTRDPMQTLMLSLGGLILSGGLFFGLNGALDTRAAIERRYTVSAKFKEYHDAGRGPGGWGYVLEGESASGDRKRFSTWVSQISKDDWELADPVAGDCYVLVLEHPGFFRMPWREVGGVRRE